VSSFRGALQTFNPKMKLVNIKREKYREAMSPEIARFVEINDETLKRNASLENFGNMLIQCDNKFS
jgi:hypothetical protein